MLHDLANDAATLEPASENRQGWRRKGRMSKLAPQQKTTDHGCARDITLQDPVFQIGITTDVFTSVPQFFDVSKSLPELLY